MNIVSLIRIGSTHVIGASDNGYLLFWELSLAALERDEFNEVPQLVSSFFSKKIGSHILGLHEAPKDIVM